jgi:hypothetical protein
MRRITLLVLLLLLAASTIPAAPGVAHTSQPAAVQQAAGVRADFNQDGFADLAIGVPFEAIGSLTDAGAVTVLYGTANGLSGTGSQLFTQVGGAVEAGDFFGNALASGDFNHDGFADLAVGAYDESVGSLRGAGAVSILYGSANGLTASGGRLFTQVGGAVEAGDFFGMAVASGDFNHDGFADLAAGAPYEDVGTSQDAGAVSVLYGSAGGLTATGGRLFTQVGGTVEDDDLFGSALASGDFNHDGFADLAAGASFEYVGSLSQAGAVSILYGSAGGLTASGGRLFTQVGGMVEAGDGFGNAVASGDFNHDGFADLAAGASGEDVGSLSEAGAISVVYGSAGGLTATGGRLFTQVGGTVEAGDWFGSTVAAGDFNQDGFADLAAGAIFEDVGSTEDAGAVSVLYGASGGLTATGGRLFTQVGSAPDYEDSFGWAVTAGDFNRDGFADLAAGAPFENFTASREDSGAVSVLYGAAGGLTASGGQLFDQDTPGVLGFPEAGDRFGDALTTGSLGISPATAPSPGTNSTTRPTAQHR